MNTADLNEQRQKAAEEILQFVAMIARYRKIETEGDTLEDAIYTWDAMIDRAKELEAKHGQLIREWGVTFHL